MIPRPSVAGFWSNGTWCELREPDGPPTGRQLLKLNRLGLLELAELPVDHPITKGEAAHAIDDITKGEAAHEAVT
jgi:hypothetical protein